MPLLGVLSHLQCFSQSLPGLHGSDAGTKYCQAACHLLPYLGFVLLLHFVDGCDRLLTLPMLMTIARLAGCVCALYTTCDSL